VHSPLLIVDHPNSPTADEFRRLLVRVLYPAEGATEINTCLVTSPTRGDGKTSTACNLAIALAEADRRVLLLDISSREASIERCFHLEEAQGLCDILCGSGTLMEYIRPVPAAPNLFVLGPGFGDGDLAGRLASRELLELLEEAEHEFEHVIIDSPPSLLMADARLLAPVVDGVVVVVGAGVSTIGMVRRCLRELDQVGATVIGIALNRMRGTRSGYMRTNYDLYYNYSVDRQKDWEHRDVPEMRVVDEPAAPEPDVVLLEHDVDERHEEHEPSRP
jgi:capsular exopolysaccharide synthesis family protein